ncbi:hypothetical protein ColTof4_14049 [Colletotrichum tofieldiae]|nr:hypothetical protein ColTof4_14049 [Colletotrichum tofieldiae]
MPQSKLFVDFRSPEDLGAAPCPTSEAVSKILRPDYNTNSAPSFTLPCDLHSKPPAIEAAAARKTIISWSLGDLIESLRRLQPGNRLNDCLLSTFLYRLQNDHVAALRSHFMTSEFRLSAKAEAVYQSIRDKEIILMPTFDAAIEYWRLFYHAKGTTFAVELDSLSIPNDIGATLILPLVERIRQPATPMSIKKVCK